MRKSWMIYDTLHTIDGNNITDRNANVAKRKMIKYTKSNGSYKEVKINKELRSVLIISTNDTDKKTICSMPDERIYLGDIIIWNNTFWLVTEIDVDNFSYYRGKIERCNIKLRWQNDSGEIIERWGVSTDIASNSEGVIQNSIINLPKLVLGIRMSLDDETSHIRRGKRFLIDTDFENPNAYIATNRNVITDSYDDDESHGLCSITISQHQRNNDTDNKELMIADYTANENDDFEGDDCMIVYEGKPEIRAGGAFKTFKVESDNNAECLWNVITLPEHEQYYTIEEYGDSIKIKAADVPEIINTKIKIQVSDNIGSFTGSLFVKVVSLLNG